MEKNTSSNVETIRRLYQALSQGDAQGMAAVCTAEVRWEITPGFPHSAAFVGLEAVFHDFFAPLMQEFESWRTVPETFLDAGDDVIALGHYHSRAKATGKDMTAGFAHVWSLDDGKAARLRHYADTVQLARALNRL
jgi:ketosteroid isomerase-like protein